MLLFKLGTEEISLKICVEVWNLLHEDLFGKCTPYEIQLGSANASWRGSNLLFFRSMYKTTYSGQGPGNDAGHSRVLSSSTEDRSSEQ